MVTELYQDIIHSEGTLNKCLIQPGFGNRNSKVAITYLGQSSLTDDGHTMQPSCSLQSVWVGQQIIWLSKTETIVIDPQDAECIAEHRKRVRASPPGPWVT